MLFSSDVVPFLPSGFSLGSSRVWLWRCPSAWEGVGVVFTPVLQTGLLTIGSKISSRTFVTDTTLTGFQLGFFFFFPFFFFLFLNKCVFQVLIHTFPLNILHNILLLKKVLCLRQKVFLPTGGTNVYYFLKEVSGCLCAHPRRGQNVQVYRLQVWNDSKLFLLWIFQFHVTCLLLRRFLQQYHRVLQKTARTAYVPQLLSPWEN